MSVPLTVPEGMDPARTKTTLPDRVGFVPVVDSLLHQAARSAQAEIEECDRIVREHSAARDRLQAEIYAAIERRATARATQRLLGVSFVPVVEDGDIAEDLTKK